MDEKPVNPVKRKVGRPPVSEEHRKETIRRRNAKNYLKMKEAREFYEKMKNEINKNEDK